MRNLIHCREGNRRVQPTVRKGLAIPWGLNAVTIRWAQQFYSRYELKKNKNMSSWKLAHKCSRAAKKWKTAQISINKMWYIHTKGSSQYIHTRQHHLAIKISAVLVQATKYMNHKTTVLSKGRQSHTQNTSYDFIYIKCPE